MLDRNCVSARLDINCLGVRLDINCIGAGLDINCIGARLDGCYGWKHDFLIRFKSAGQVQSVFLP
jgi:hypothetical protein